MRCARRAAPGPRRHRATEVHTKRRRLRGPRRGCLRSAAARRAGLAGLDAFWTGLQCAPRWYVAARAAAFVRRGGAPRLWSGTPGVPTRSGRRSCLYIVRACAADSPATCLRLVLACFAPRLVDSRKPAADMRCAALRLELGCAVRTLIAPCRHRHPVRALRCSSVASQASRTPFLDALPESQRRQVRRAPTTRRARALRLPRSSRGSISRADGVICAAAARVERDSFQPCGGVAGDPGPGARADAACVLSPAVHVAPPLTA